MKLIETITTAFVTATNVFTKWFRTTDLWMYISNHRNGVKILSDAEYEAIVRKGIKATIYV